jgi:hypothetical protein
MPLRVVIQHGDGALEVWTPDERVAALVVALLGTPAGWWAQTPELLGTLTIEPQPSSSPAGRYCLHARIGACTERFTALALHELARLLDWYTNRVFVAHLSGRAYLLHAAAVVRNGGALLLPARSGGGKSTLAVALALHGYGYLTDEVAVVDRRTLRLWPFAKSVALRSGGMQALTREFPGWDEGLQPNARIPTPEGLLVGVQRWLPPAAGPGFPITHIVFPDYRLDRGAGALHPLGRGEALIRLIGQRYASSEGLDFRAFTLAMTELVRGAACSTLTMGSLRSAVAYLDRLFAGEHSSDTPAAPERLPA